MAGQHVTAAIVIARFHHRSYGRKRETRESARDGDAGCVRLFVEKKTKEDFSSLLLKKKKKRVIFGGVSERRQSFSPPSLLLRKERDEKETE